MKRKLTIIGMIVAAILFVGLTAFAFQPTSQAAAQTEETPSSTRTVTVSGNGRVGAQPDMAVVSFGVQTDAETAAEALANNSTQMSDVISATLNAGIAEEDIQTQGLSLQPIYNSSDPDGTPELSGYRASNIVEVTVRELDGLGDLLDTAVTNGANNIQGIRFVVSNQEELETTARENAMNDAQQKAEQLSELAGASLGAVQMITESTIAPPAPVAFAAQDIAATNVPIQGGTQFIEVHVQVVWELQ